MFESQHGDAVNDTTKHTLLKICADPCPERISEALHDESCMKMISLFNEFKRAVREGSLGKSGQFGWAIWIVYGSCCSSRELQKKITWTYT